MSAASVATPTTPSSPLSTAASSSSVKNGVDPSNGSGMSDRGGGGSMAAAIKMDELLVLWLGSDHVYDNVLKLIETHRGKTGDAGVPKLGKVGGVGGPLSPSRANSSEILDSIVEAGREESKDVKGEEEKDGTDAAVPRGIPPFYRPRGVPASLAVGGDGDEKKQEDEEEEKEETKTSPPTPLWNTNQDQRWDGAEDSPRPSFAFPEGDSDGESGTPARSGSIRDQVEAIFRELGTKPASSSFSEHDAHADSTPSLFHSHSAPLDAAAHQKVDPHTTLAMDHFVRITKDVCQFPTFFNGPLYKRILLLSSSKSSQVTLEMFRQYWKTEMQEYDAMDRFFRLLKAPDRDFIVREDFSPYIQELLNDHPGLEFLSSHAEFQEKYAITVITRIFYSVNRCHSGRITSRQLRHSDLLSAFCQVDEEEDINKVTRYFSYEHFYVLYCRFWELDHDRDYRITREDLLKYGDHCLSHMIVDRIFDAAPRPFYGGSTGDMAAASPDGGNNAPNRDFLSYEDFIFFMLSEEDKSNEVSARYWFTCVDVDGDGKLNNMEMRSFYAVQLHRMQCMGHEVVPFEDMLCQMMDMIKPQNAEYLTVDDFLQSECFSVSGALFDALFNLNKYLQFEQRDPFMERQKREDEFETDWDRFACIDYNRLAMEEEAREEEAMEIDWVTVDEEDDDDEEGEGDDLHSLGLKGASEAPF